MFVFNPAINSARSAAPLASPTLKSAFAHAHSTSYTSSPSAYSNPAAMLSTDAALTANPMAEAAQPRTPRLPSVPTLPLVFTPPPTPFPTPVTPGTGPCGSYFMQTVTAPIKGLASGAQIRATVTNEALSLQDRRNAIVRTLRLPSFAPVPPTVTPFPTPTTGQPSNIHVQLAHILPHTPDVGPGAERLGLGLFALKFIGIGAIATPTLETIKEPRLDDVMIEDIAEAQS